MDRNEMLSLVWDYYGVSEVDRDAKLALMGWTEIANVFGLGEKHTRDVFAVNDVFPTWLLDKYCRVTYMAKPPDRMSIFWDERQVKEDYWDDLGLYRYRVCTPNVRATWRPYGGPYFLRVIDLAKKFAKDSLAELDIIDGEMPVTRITKATLIPVCWDRRALEKMARYRRLCMLIKKSYAGRGLKMHPSLRIKSLDFERAGWLQYAAIHASKGRVNLGEER